MLFWVIHMEKETSQSNFSMGSFATSRMAERLCFTRMRKSTLGFSIMCAMRL